MWMMGYNEEVNSPPDSFNGRKLRPLVPRPSQPNMNASLHKADLLSFNPHLGGMIDQSKRELSSQQVVVTSRWNPTPEQLQTLEELYQRGTRTPSADQIQHITSELRKYGKIEGKNVFYWFQNHKARERQKRRRQTELEPYHEQQQQCHDVDSTQCKESGANNKTGVEIEQTKSCCWGYSTSTSPTTHVPDPYQKTATLARAAGLKAAAWDPECVRDPADGWLRLHDREKFSLERNATWHLLHRRFTQATTTTSTAITTAVTNDTVGTTHPNFANNDQDQTLQLFPLRSSGENGEDGGEAETDTCRFDNSYQFFEFLPLKN